MGQCLCIIKPDVIKYGHVGKVISMIETQGCQIQFAQIMHLSYEKACEFYQEHKGKDFFERNAKYMSSGPILVLIVEDIYDMTNKCLISTLRDTAGETDSKKAREDTIRYLFGTELPKNAIHISDSEEAFQRELEVLFPLWGQRFEGCKK